MRRKNTTTEMMKEYISDSLLILMADKSYNEISIGEITAKAGVNRSTYYRNFNSKNEIVKFYYSRIIYEYLETVNNDMLFLDYLNKMFAHFYKYKKELLRIYKNGVSYLILDALNETFIAFGEVDTFEEQFKRYYHTGGIYNTFLLWFSDGMKKSPEHMSEITIRILPDWYRPMLL